MSSVTCMPLSRKFLTESTGEKIVNIGQYLAKIWTKCNSLLFWGHPIHGVVATAVRRWQFYAQTGRLACNVAGQSSCRCVSASCLRLDINAASNWRDYDDWRRTNGFTCTMLCTSCHSLQTVRSCPLTIQWCTVVLLEKQSVWLSPPSVNVVNV